LKIETVLASNIVADVCDLNDHTFALKPRMRSTAPIVTLARKPQLETLPAIFISIETMVPTDRSRCEGHAQVHSGRKWLVVWTRSGSATRGSLATTD